MARVVKGSSDTGTWARPATPQMHKVGDEWVSKGWNELEHKGWVFKAVSRPPVKEGNPALSSLSTNLGLGPIPLPKMLFLDNVLECYHKDSGVNIAFSAYETLAAWHQQQQTRHGSKLSASHYDLTYCSPYSGSITKDREILREKLRLARRIEAPDFATAVKCKERIPVHMLQDRGHIHFYDHLNLVSDHLSGRGRTEITVKIRVMSDFFLVLLRCYIFMEEDSIYMRDVRFFHRFGASEVLRDEEIREASAAHLKAAVSRVRPMSASIETATHDARYYTNPEQVWEALEAATSANFSIAIGV